MINWILIDLEKSILVHIFLRIIFNLKNLLIHIVLGEIFKKLAIFQQAAVVSIPVFIIIALITRLDLFYLLAS